MKLTASAHVCVFFTISYAVRGRASNTAREVRDVSAGTTWVKKLWGHRAGDPINCEMMKTARELDRRPTQCRDPGGLMV